MTGVLGLFVAAAPPAGWMALRGSLPPLDGRRALDGLGADVVVERDANGIPTVRADGKEDACRALGYLHAQDRFFQMDLMRRQSAGELAELFGAAALPRDREARRHRFRWRAARTVGRFDPEQRRWLTAYTEGVNAGLAALETRPVGVLPVARRPRPWSTEDTILVVDAMTMSLQEHDGLDERLRQAVLDTYGAEALAFLRPLVRERTAALDGSSMPAPPVPDAAHLTPRPGVPGATGAAGEIGAAGDWRGGRNWRRPTIIRATGLNSDRTILPWQARGWQAAAQLLPTTCTWA